MKNRFKGSLAILTLALASLFITGVQAQTTDEGAGPSEQPSAPLEMGQPQAPYPDQAQPSDSGQGGDIEEAQPGGPSGEEPAKVDQGVGRISMIHGDVSTQRGDSGDWSAVVLNQPVLNGDKVSTGPGGRAEVQLDFANILRLGSSAQVNISNFTKKYIQVQVAQGLVNYSVFGESETEPEIDTPNVAVHPAHQDGVFRIEVRPDGDSIIIVRKGEAQISTPQGIADLRQGDMATVRGSGSDARYKISAAPGRDDWDRWNNDRDRMIHSADAWRHTNKYYVGAEDLDRHGRWENADDYGQVWVPDEPQDWAPYRDGNWVYEPYYGWTWVGYEPWGWAPYHYGRWMWYGNSWAWWPGPVWGGGFYRPFWAPAYVSFFGFGGGWGFGVGFGGWGGFGWLPIGPCDAFFPWWGGYGGRFGVVNVTNIHITNITNINRFGGIAPLHGGTRFSNLARLHDPHIGRALSTVGAGKFGAGPTRAVAASATQLRSARMMTGNLPVVPTHASLSASGRAAASSTIHNNSSQHFFGRQSTSRPESFQQHTANLQRSMQQHHVSPVPAGGRSSGTMESRAGVSAPVTGGKPSAGTPSTGRETNSSSGRTFGNQGTRAFPPANNNAQAGNTRSDRPTASTSMNRAGSSSVNRPAEPNRSEWKTFTPPSHSSESTTSRGNYNAQASTRNSAGSYWNRTAPSSGSYSRESNSSSSARGGNYERGSSSRPQLNMRQPIVRPRSSDGYPGRSSGEGSRGAYHGSPSYGGSRGESSYGGGRSTPSHGGGRSAPSYSGGHSAPSYEGGHSAPSYGGGRSSYGGGSRSVPGYSGAGSHSAPGYGGGGTHSTPSYGGGGGSHSTPSYSGGAHSSGGGGSHPSGGGGSHSNGGGHPSGHR